MTGFDVRAIREQFPGLKQSVRGRPLVYFDSAATTLKPKSVIEALTHFYSYETANVHRGAHFLSDQATRKYEESRQKVATFLNARSPSEIVFTKGTTESVNLVAQTLGRHFLQPGDEIVITDLEHHANIVPWHLLSKEKGVTVRFAPVDDKGDLIFDEFEKLLNARTKIVSVVHASNTIGTVLDIKRIALAAHKVGAKVLVDAAQSVSMMKLDVQELQCDFLAFSAHKLFGPYGVGVLYGREDLLNELPPWQGGGAIIDKVEREGTSFLPAPQRFEPGTPNIGGVIALKQAIEFVESLPYEEIQKHERELTSACIEILRNAGAELIGSSATRTNIISFNLPGAHGSDVGHLLDQQGIAVRTGHHCTQVLCSRFGVTGTVRVSFSVYNTLEEVERFDAALRKVKEFL